MQEDGAAANHSAVVEEDRVAKLPANHEVRKNKNKIYKEKESERESERHLQQYHVWLCALLYACEVPRKSLNDVCICVRTWLTWVQRVYECIVVLSASVLGVLFSCRPPLSPLLLFLPLHLFLFPFCPGSSELTGQHLCQCIAHGVLCGTVVGSLLVVFLSVRPFKLLSSPKQNCIFLLTAFLLLPFIFPFFSKWGKLCSHGSVG